MLYTSYVVGITVLAVSPLLFLIARLLAKRSKRLPWSVDDTLLVLSLLSLYLFVAVLLVTMIVDPHMFTATRTHLRTTLLVLWLFRIPMAMSLALTRCAIAIFFIRTLYTHAFSTLRRIGQGCIVFAIALGITTIVGILLHCRPVKHNWTIPLKNPRHCFDLKPFVVALAGIGLALDTITWTMPHYVVWGLRLRVSYKIAITCIFAFGLLNIIIGGLRISTLTQVPYGRDVTSGIGATMLWSIAQISTGIIVACFLYLRPLFEKIIPQRHWHVSDESPRLQDRRASIITVTTRIEVHNTCELLPIAVVRHFGYEDLWAPRFEVGQSDTASSGHDRACCPRCPFKCTC